MTFLQMQAQVQAGVKRDDVDYALAINQALRQIQNRRSWTFMKKVSNPLTLLANTLSVTLPADFKELRSVPDAVTQILDNPAVPGQPVYMPVDVVREYEEVRRIWAFGGIIPNTHRVWIERNAANSTLNVIVPVIEDSNFKLKYYGYLPDLSADGDTSPFIDAYPQMVLNKSKAIAFDSINDPFAMDAEGKFEANWLEAVRQDAYADVRGFVNRM